MSDGYNDLVHSIKQHLEIYPLETFRKGDMRKLLINNHALIQEALKTASRKGLLDKLNHDLGISISYNHFNNVINSKESKEESTKKPKGSEKHQTGQANIETKDKSEIDKLGRDKFPIKDINDEELKKWEHLDLPKVALHSLIMHGVSVEQYKALNITTSSASSINAKVIEYCNKLESDWYSNELKKGVKK